MSGRYRKKPVEIEAVQWAGEEAGALAIIEWIEAVGGGKAYLQAVSLMHTPNIIIETLEGNMAAQPGDWIIRGVKGEFYPCKPDIFDATYEAVA